MSVYKKLVILLCFFKYSINSVNIVFISRVKMYCSKKFIEHFQAYVVLGQFLVLKKDRELFQEWMKDTCQANTKQSNDCYQCLVDWCDEFL